MQVYLEKLEIVDTICHIVILNFSYNSSFPIFLLLSLGTVSSKLPLLDTVRGQAYTIACFNTVRKPSSHTYFVMQAADSTSDLLKAILPFTEKNMIGSFKSWHLVSRI